MSRVINILSVGSGISNEQLMNEMSSDKWWKAVPLFRRKIQYLKSHWPDEIKIYPFEWILVLLIKLDFITLVTSNEYWKSRVISPILSTTLNSDTIDLSWLGWI